MCVVCCLCLFVCIGIICVACVVVCWFVSGCRVFVVFDVCRFNVLVVRVLCLLLSLF